MLARFATGASFSADCRGGGTESNSKFLPFMIQMAGHLVEQGSPTQRRSMAKSVSTYISSPSRASEETVQFMMVNSLLSESYESWLQHRRVFVQRGIYHAYMQGGSSSENLLAVVRPMLVYSGLIELMQRFFKGKPCPPEEWEAVMKERLVNVKGMLAFSKEVMTLLDDLTSAADLQEAFDVIGMLPDVLSAGVSSCEDFVNAAITSGKTV